LHDRLSKGMCFRFSDSTTIWRSACSCTICFEPRRRTRPATRNARMGESGEIPCLSIGGDDRLISDLVSPAWHVHGGTPELRRPRGTNRGGTPELRRPRPAADSQERRRHPRPRRRHLL
jgi:hypothetical protein